MNIGGIRFPRLSPADLDGLLERARSAKLTYLAVGTTLSGADLPTWRRHLGHGPDVFDRACEAMRTWAPQRRIGARVHPKGAQLVENETLLVVLRKGPIEVLAPVRIISVIGEDDRFGYAYGTLPGHPEQGEESFMVERAADGGVTATIVVDARPGTVPARLAAPLVKIFQRRAIARYLDALS